MYYNCKDKSLSETSGFQEKIIADGMNNLILQEGLYSSLWCGNIPNFLSLSLFFLREYATFALSHKY
ncbi:hypothetical protein E5353_13690 [Bacteroides caecimuris]|uniref:Uncharacterized protein n=1 Tax=Bacteroides caecimuris TaxID=1796613 RepID=A0A4S2CS43_9BACE|nr:hypothetical protein E5353_13690 [Bacteroides caecimuris]